MKENRYIILFSILILVGVSAFMLFPNFQTQEFDQNVVEDIMDGVTTTVLDEEIESSSTDDKAQNTNIEKSNPSKINVTARLKLPSIENFIELIPRQTPPKVRIFGRRYLVFFEVTNLNFLFGSIILLQLGFHQRPRFVLV